MKKILFSIAVLLVFSVQSYAQMKFKASTSVGGASLNRGDTFDYVIFGNGVNNNTTRQLLFDIMYDQVNFELVSVNHTGTGGLALEAMEVFFHKDLISNYLLITILTTHGTL